MYKNIMRISNHYRVRNIRWYMTMVYALAFSALRDPDLWQPSQSWKQLFSVFSPFSFLFFFCFFFFLFFWKWKMIDHLELYTFSCACNLFLFLYIYIYKTQISCKIRSDVKFDCFLSFFSSHSSVHFIYKNEKLVLSRNIYIYIYFVCIVLTKHCMKRIGERKILKN